MSIPLSLLFSRVSFHRHESISLLCHSQGQPSRAKGGRARGGRARDGRTRSGNGARTHQDREEMEDEEMGSEGENDEHQRIENRRRFTRNTIRSVRAKMTAENSDDESTKGGNIHEDNQSGIVRAEVKVENSDGTGMSSRRTHWNLCRKLSTVRDLI